MFKSLILLSFFLFGSPSFALVIPPSSAPQYSDGTSYVGALTLWRTTPPMGSYSAKGINWPVPYWLFSGATPITWDYYTPSSCYWNTINSPQQYYCQVQVDQYTLVSSCPSGMVKSTTSGVCMLPNLSDYDNDPYSCIKNGGLPDFAFVPHGGNFKGYMYTRSDGSVSSGINIKCNSKTETLAKNALVLFISKVAMSPIKFGPFDTVGNTLKRGLYKLKDILSKFVDGTKKITDLTISLPRYDPHTGFVDVEIIPHDIPAGADGVTPSRAPAFDVEAYNSFLREEYFPSNPNILPSASDPYISLATLDRFNRDNEIFKDNGTDPVTFTFKTDPANIWKSTRGAETSSPAFDAPKMNPSLEPLPNVSLAAETPAVDAPKFAVVEPAPIAPPPAVIKIADVPTTKTEITTIEGSSPVRQWTLDTSYPDGSTLREETKIDEQTKKGVKTSTVQEPGGRSSSTSIPFEVPFYEPGSPDPKKYVALKTGPVSPTPLPLNTISRPNPVDPLTNLPAPSTVALTSPTAPSTATGQDLINASMPSYAFPALTEFVPFDSNPLSQMMTGSSEFFNNVGIQLNSVKSSFDSTKALLDGKWNPPVIPVGACGNSMVLSWHGKSIDLCPPMVNSTSKASPIVTPIVTLGGMALSITIFIGGF